MPHELHIADDEREIVRSPAALLGRVSPSRSDGVFGSVGVRVSRFTFRVGESSGDSSIVEHELGPVDDGVLVKTDRRVVYLGDENQVDVRYADLVGWNLEGSVLRIYAKGHSKPFIFAVEGPHQKYWRAQEVGVAEEPPEILGPLDPGGDSGWQQPGFPHRLLVGEKVVNADPLLPFAAAFLDGVAEREIDTLEVAHGIGISYERAKTLMPQLTALGFVEPTSADRWTIFDPDGITVPSMSQDQASPPGLSPDDAALRLMALDNHDYLPDDAPEPEPVANDDAAQSDTTAPSDP